jgi:hypothetical protein
MREARFVIVCMCSSFVGANDNGPQSRDGLRAKFLELVPEPRRAPQAGRHLIYKGR